MNNWFYDTENFKKKEQDKPIVLSLDGLSYKSLNNISDIANRRYNNADTSFTDKLTSVKNWTVAGLIGGFIYAIVYKKNTLIAGTIGAVTLGTLGYIIKINS